ncbi:MAG TPA: hypothetical protein VGG39_21970 [Polyangiaceae bacterium]
MRRRWIARGVTLGIVGLFAACTFPSVQYDNGEGGAGGEGGPDATQHDGASSSGGKGDGAGGGDGTASEGSGDDGTSSGGDDSSGSSSGDSGLSDVGVGDAIDEYVFEAAPDAPSCDQDQDHDNAKGGVCGGTDCDDDDPRAYLNEPDFQTYTPTQVTKGDWNCDGILETQFTPNFGCGGLLKSNCTGTAGFTDAPACGATSPNFITCKLNLAGVLCVTDTTSSNVQGCK